MKKSLVLETPIGAIEVQHQRRKIVKINLHSSSQARLPEGDFENEIERQIQSYFYCASFNFDLPLDLQGTQHQQAVWSSLINIPPGQTKTYGQLAKALTSSAQAVGNACRRNPIPIIVPCHRIVAAQAIGGFAGQTRGDLITIKRKLLVHEGLEF